MWNVFGSCARKYHTKFFFKILQTTRKFELWIFDNSNQLLIFRCNTVIMVSFLFLFIIPYAVEIIPYAALFTDETILSPRFALV